MVARSNISFFRPMTESDRREKISSKEESEKVFSAKIPLNTNYQKTPTNYQKNSSSVKKERACVESEDEEELIEASFIQKN